jgi:hypothetical protein
MESWKSLDPYKQILATLLSDIQLSLNSVITPRQYRNTVNKLCKRSDAEGIGFLTKTLPRLGKALDKALSGGDPIDSVKLGFKPLPNSKLPKLFGELFSRVFAHSGEVLQSPCVTSVKGLRQLLFVYYKLDVAYAPALEQRVIDGFIKTEDEISIHDDEFHKVMDLVDEAGWANVHNQLHGNPSLVRRARILLAKVFEHFDPQDIKPSHGPGAVSTGERLWDKWNFSRINPRIQQHYPFDEYFCSSKGHVCDKYRHFDDLVEVESLAKVILVPKDSRGPRLISCEPLEFQWIQQGLGRQIVKHLELHPLTRYNIHFTDQIPNRVAALYGSQNGRYATLDLKEASDRITTGLVRLLFPSHIYDVLKDSRTLGTVLPDGRILKLRKFAPMGSALCFPVMATCIWAILTAGTTDTDARESILVYGDDVIVKTEESANAMMLLESFGLKVNRDKSCTHGFFRESCGMDAYRGADVTPVRLREKWAPHQSPDNYTSYVEFSNNLFNHGFVLTSRLIADWIVTLYKYGVATADDHLDCPSLVNPPWNIKPLKRRWNAALQRAEYKVLCSVARPLTRVVDGWAMLLRYFTEGSRPPSFDPVSLHGRSSEQVETQAYAQVPQPFSVRKYTRRKANQLAYRWRG